MSNYARRKALRKWEEEYRKERKEWCREFTEKYFYYLNHMSYINMALSTRITVYFNKKGE